MGELGFKCLSLCNAALTVKRDEGFGHVLHAPNLQSMFGPKEGGYRLAGSIPAIAQPTRPYLRCYTPA